MHQLGQLAKAEAKLAALDARVWVVTAYPRATVLKTIKKKGYAHRFLTDGRPLIDALGLANNGHKDRISEPATFVLAPDGAVLLADRTTKAKREPIATIVAAIEGHRGS